MTTAEATRATLPLAAVLADLRAAHAVASGQAARNLKADVQWCLIDISRACAADPAAHARAVELARAGDADAIAALRLATRLKPLGPPSGAVVHNSVRGNFGSSFTGSAVPGGLLDHLADARRRGKGFDGAWASALVALGVTSGLWNEVLRATREAWRAAYEREQPPVGFVVLPWGDEDCGHEF